MWNKRALTLIELVIVLAIVALAISAIYATYVKQLDVFKSESKSAESEIAQTMSLEILRRDILHAGFGLPWDLNGISYGEATEGEASPYNDAPSNAPRPFVIGNEAMNNSDYFVIKSAIAAVNEVTKKWGLVENGNFTAIGEGGDFDSDDYYIVLRLTDGDGNTVMQLMKHDDSWWWKEGDGFPTGDGVFLALGVSNNVEPRMPFNRVDYYLDCPQGGCPEKCCSTTYVFYRATINHSNGERNEMPLLDCVREFQVFFGIDESDNGTIEWGEELPDTAQDIREKVKAVKVFLIYQEGQKMPEAVSRGLKIQIPNHEFTPQGEEEYYRWKSLELTVKPMNLIR